MKRIKCQNCENEFPPHPQLLRICAKNETIVMNGQDVERNTYYQCYDCPTCGFRNNVGEWLPEVGNNKKRRLL